MKSELTILKVSIIWEAKTGRFSLIPKKKSNYFQKFDPETLDQLWDLGIFGMVLPEKYGGLGLNNTQIGRLAESLGMNDLSLSTTIGAHQSIGYKVSGSKR